MIGSIQRNIISNEKIALKMTYALCNYTHAIIHGRTGVKDESNDLPSFHQYQCEIIYYWSRYIEYARHFTTEDWEDDKSDDEPNELSIEIALPWQMTQRKEVIM